MASDANSDMYDTDTVSKPPNLYYSKRGGIQETQPAANDIAQGAVKYTVRESLADFTGSLDCCCVEHRRRKFSW